MDMPAQAVKLPFLIGQFCEDLQGEIPTEFYLQDSDGVHHISSRFELPNEGRSHLKS
jgi:hypothetical protein